MAAPIFPTPRRYAIQPAVPTDPTGAWYVFDTIAPPPRTVAICPNGGADAFNVRLGLEILEANRRLVRDVFGVVV